MPRPALLMSMSIPIVTPISPTVSAMASGLSRSRIKLLWSGPRREASSVELRTSMRARLAPASANRSAIASPIPPAAPVIKTVKSARSRMAPSFLGIHKGQPKAAREPSDVKAARQDHDVADGYGPGPRQHEDDGVGHFLRLDQSAVFLGLAQILFRPVGQ